MKSPLDQPLYWYDFRSRPSVRTLRPGQAFTFEVSDSDGLGPDLKPMPARLFPPGPCLGNPLYGPIHVDGALPGDAVGVEFLRIAPNRNVARTWIAPNHGYLPTRLSKARKRMIHWKLGTTTARMENPFGRLGSPVQLAPFLGSVGTAAGTKAAGSTLEAGAHGGNIDLPELVAGSTLWLPVIRPGGLLYLGDMHAAQGHGEMVGGGLEVSGTARIRVRLKKKWRLRWPRFTTAHRRGCIVVKSTLEQGVHAATAELIGWLTEDGWHRADAYMFTSQSCAIHLGGINQPGRQGD